MTVGKRKGNGREKIDDDNDDDDDLKNKGGRDDAGLLDEEKEGEATTQKVRASKKHDEYMNSPKPI